MFLSKFIVVVASVTSLAGARSINLSAITTRANSGNGTNVTTEPSPWTPVPVNPTFINGTITTPEAAPNGGNHPAPPAPPGVKGNAFCYPTGRGTCSVGLYLTYDQSAMNIYIFNNGCESPPSGPPLNPNRAGPGFFKGKTPPATLVLTRSPQAR